MAGIAGDPGTSSEQGVAGTTDVVGIPEPVRRNPAESLIDGKKQITVRAVRVKDLSGNGDRAVYADSDGDLVVGSGDESGGLPFARDAWSSFTDGSGNVSSVVYYLSSVTQGQLNYTYNAYGNISTEELIVSGSTERIWTWSYDTADNQSINGAAKS